MMFVLLAFSLHLLLLKLMVLDIVGLVVFVFLNALQVFRESILPSKVVSIVSRPPFLSNEL